MINICFSFTAAAAVGCCWVFIIRLRWVFFQEESDNDNDDDDERKMTIIIKTTISQLGSQSVGQLDSVASIVRPATWFSVLAPASRLSHCCCCLPLLIVLCVVVVVVSAPSSALCFIVIVVAF